MISMKNKFSEAFLIRTPCYFRVILASDPKIGGGPDQKCSRKHIFHRNHKNSIFFAHSKFSQDAGHLTRTSNSQ